MTTAYDAVVVGAGVVGCSIALELSRDGRRVLVVDKGPSAGSGSTSSSSAVVRFNYSTLDGVVTSWVSGQRWMRWADHLGMQDPAGMARFHRVGKVVIEPPHGNSTDVLSLLDRVGVPYEVWDAATLRARVPALDTGRYWPPKTVDDPHFWDDATGEVTAYFTPDAGFVDDPQLAAHNLMVAAVACGATFEFGVQVSGIDRADGRVAGVRFADGASRSAPVVVNAAGPWSAMLNRIAGVGSDFSVGTRPLRQEVHVAPAPPGFALDDGGTVCADVDLGTYFRPQPGGSVLVGGLEPECDPLVWVDDPDLVEPTPTVEIWQAQVYRLARRLPALQVQSRPTGLAACYDVTPDWVPIYDRTELDGFYVAIGTSGNQFKNAPVVGRLMAELITTCEAGRDHDRDPVEVRLHECELPVRMAHYSRRRHVLSTSNSVLG